MKILSAIERACRALVIVALVSVSTWPDIRPAYAQIGTTGNFPAANSVCFTNTAVTGCTSGASQSWTVPAGVTLILVDAMAGGQGGAGGQAVNGTAGGGGGACGSGTTAFPLLVSPGQVLTIAPGAAGLGGAPAAAGGVVSVNTTITGSPALAIAFPTLTVSGTVPAAGAAGTGGAGGSGVGFVNIGGSGGAAGAVGQTASGSQGAYYTVSGGGGGGGGTGVAGGAGASSNFTGTRASGGGTSTGGGGGGGCSSTWGTGGTGATGTATTAATPSAATGFGSGGGGGGGNGTGGAASQGFVMIRY